MIRSALFSGLTAAGRMLERGSALLHYAAAGTLRIADLEGAIQRQWSEFGIGADVQQGLMPWEQDLYGRHIGAQDHVLVIGCGAGRDLLALLATGHRADGLDIAGIDVARREVRARGFASTLIEESIETAALPSAYDVLVFSWYTYAYLPESERRVRTLARLRKHLRPSGRILVSLPPIERGPRRIYVGVARAASWLAGADWRPEPGDALFVASSGAVFPCYRHVFAEGEAEAEFARAGFRVAERSVAGGVQTFVLDGG